jgi:sialidase-1
MWSHVIYSDDHGRTWRRGGSTGPDCNESTVVELRDGSLLLNMRSYAKQNRRAVSHSSDGGLTWSSPGLKEELVEPVCQASLIRTSRGVLLFSNPASEKRVKMTVKASMDEGRTWRTLRTVHEGPSAYSNLVELPGDRFGLLYECGSQNPYEGIAWITFELNRDGKLKR